MSRSDSTISQDEAARRRIATSLEESLLVEAAAGTGKTTVLVARVIAVLQSGQTTVDRLVAVTFTRKAAGELKLRLRQELDRAREKARSAEERQHLEAAVARLEEAHIGTIHSFCAEILRERPVEAGIDPAFREIDEEEASQRYSRAFQGWIERKLAEMPRGLQRALSRMALESSPGGTSPLGRLRDAGRNLVEWRDFPVDWERRSFDREAEIDRLLDEVDALSDHFHACPNRHDYLRKALEPAALFAIWVQRSESVGNRDYDELEARLVDLERQLQRKASWKGRGKWFSAEVTRETVLDERALLFEELAKFKNAADGDLAAQLHGELREVVDDYSELKRRGGELDFLDLLLVTRNLVKEQANVRRYLQQRFTHLFVDEFQDTDPLQAEILLLLAANDPEQDDWVEARPTPGKLFLVGDPKQSIYRFRRADVLLYQQIKERLTTAEGGVGLIHLSRSFRSVRPLQQAINASFSTQMGLDSRAGQPAYIPLDPHREAPSDQPHVVALPAPEPYGRSRITKTQIEACLPDTVAAYIEWLTRESGWVIEDPEERGNLRPIAPRDIAILFRRFLSWNRDVTEKYLRSLEARGLPHLLVGGRSFHQREEVETLRAALTAIEWPDDELSIFATLRGDLFAISDHLLVRFRSSSGSLHPFRPLGELEDPELFPIVNALSKLAQFHRQRNHLPIVETIHRLLELSRAQAGFALRPAGNQVLANIQRICDLARSFEVRGGLSFRGFVERLNDEAERPSSAQAPVLEEGADGVRIMTAHAAKGLEFPVVILADITANLVRREAGLYVDTQKGLAAYKLLGCSPWSLQDNAELELDRDRAESIRVAYVAATRARDLLVVPAVGTDPWASGWISPLNDAIYPERPAYRRAEAAPGCPPFGQSTVLRYAESFGGMPEEPIKPGQHHPKAGEHSVVWWDPRCLRLGTEGNFGLRREQILSPGDSEDPVRHGLDRYQSWHAAREQALETGKRPQFAVVTPSEIRQPPEGFSPSLEVIVLPRKRGRPSGSRFGTLVHTIFRDIEFGAELDQIRALAELHARLLEADEEEVTAATACVAAALAHPLMQRAAAATICRREAPLTVALDDHRRIEGTLDLAFCENDSWTVVDFKTDTDLNTSREKYLAQLAWYLKSLHLLTNAPVHGVILGL